MIEHFYIYLKDAAKAHRQYDPYIGHSIGRGIMLKRITDAKFKTRDDETGILTTYHGAVLECKGLMSVAKTEFGEKFVTDHLI